MQLLKINCGAGHSIALSLQGKVYTWGLNLLGQLGHDDTDARWSPTLVSYLKDFKIVDISAGAGHSFSVDENNQVYSWGASADFQTGIYVKPVVIPGKDTKQFLKVPQRVEGLNCKKSKVLQISCGLKHTAVIMYCQITRQNEIICFGGNEYGQCGNGEHGKGKLKTNFETHMSLKGKSIQIVECGAAHTILKTLNNEIFSFGLNDKGQLGLGVSGNFSSTPHKLKRFTSFPVVKISCSDESSCLITSNGDLYVWGRNTSGMFDSETGMFALDQPILKPTLIKGLKV